jgi:hypothetical protein
MTQSYNLKAVFSLIPKPVITVLTVLQFAPAEEVNVKVYITDQNNQPLSDKLVTMQILDAEGTVLRQSSATSDVNGEATITIITPSYSGTYNATFTVEEATVSQQLEILPKIVIATTGAYKKTQTYIPGDYDFVFEAEIKDTDGNLLTGYSVETKLIDISSGTEITGLDYVKFTIEGSRIFLQAKLYDWYKAQDPNFNYDEKGVKIEITVAKPETHISNTFSDTVTMTAPYLIALVPSSVELGKTGITISIRDPYGNIPQITLDNIEVIIQTPTGAVYSTRQELADKTILIHGDISISFKFEEQGTYKITIRYYNLPWEQPTSTYNIMVTEKAEPYSILTSPYFWGIVGLIVLIILLRRRRSD